MDFYDYDMQHRLRVDVHHEKEWTVEHTADVAEEYAKFLVMSRLKVEGYLPRVAFVPSKQVDEAWHNHILFTKRYADICRHWVGRFIDHFPVLQSKRDQVTIEHHAGLYDRT